MNLIFHPGTCNTNYDFYSKNHIKMIPSLLFVCKIFRFRDECEPVCYACARVCMCVHMYVCLSCISCISCVLCMRFRACVSCMCSVRFVRFRACVFVCFVSGLRFTNICACGCLCVLLVYVCFCLCMCVVPVLM